jgi:nitrite reductase/ring-hydroxylating ferredoxin subunit
MRALRNGATANEILDALLTAFPSLGLTKIIWAIDIILQMDLPEFNPEMLAQKPDWYNVCQTSELENGKVIFRSVKNRSMFIYSDSEGIKIYDSHCPHRAENNNLESVNGLELTCPRHHWKFDLKTGNCIENGRHPLKQYQHKTENNELFVFF